MEMKTELKKLAVELYDIGAIKYGDFVTKVGLKTPIYLDLRVIISYPKLLVRISTMLWSLIDDSKCEHICGVPYTALPIATVISTEANVPMIIRRKEIKSYGTKKLIEGNFKRGDFAVIVEDIITSGSSVLETRQDLLKEGLCASLALVIVDRQQGGKKNLENAGICVKSLFRITELIEYLVQAGRLTEESLEIVKKYLETSQAPVKCLASQRLSQNFETRAKSSKNPVAAKLLRLMAKKKSTICLAADLMKYQEVLDLADLAGPHIAALKVHADILVDFDRTFIIELKSLSKKHDFLIIEDRKFSDIGHVVSQQFRSGFYSIAEWADLITVHAIPGRSVLDGLSAGLDGLERSERGVFVVAEMSSKGALTTGDYVRSAIVTAEGHELLAGFVCQNDTFDDPGLVQLTPGVKLSRSVDGLGQQYNTPEDVVKSGADLVVVGRGITESRDKLQAISEYKRVLFEAYENRVK